MKTYRRLLAYLRPYMWPRGVLAIVFMLSFSALESSVPFIVRYTFDQVFTHQQAAALSLAVVAVVGIGVVRGRGRLRRFVPDGLGRPARHHRSPERAHTAHADARPGILQQAARRADRVARDRRRRRSCETPSPMP
jgi:hypothetical protein